MDWFWSRIGHFSIFFFLGNIGKENVFDDILERKTPFQAIKARSAESQKIEIFPNELVHGFGPNFAIFPSIVLGNVGKENVFYDILERKNTF